MSIEKERLSSDVWMPAWILMEHQCRYVFAAQYVRDKVVVDCACGAGVGSDVFAKAGASQVEAFDVSEPSIEAACSRYRLPNLRFRVANGLALPLSAQLADVFISLETIEHVPEDEQFLREVRRVLKPGGTLICSTPNRIVTNPGKALHDRPWNKFHVREYSEEQFVALLSRAFSHVMLYGQNPVHRARVQLMEVLGRILPFHGAVRFNQARKLAFSCFDRMENHAVRLPTPNHALELLLAVCS